METLLRMLLLALLAALSPLALTSTIVVLKSRRARLNGSLFAGGFLLGEGIGWTFALAVGSAFSLGEGDGIVSAVFELAFGALLFAVGWRLHRGGSMPGANGPGAGRTKAFLTRLGNLTPFTALAVGTVFGIGVPKRLTITLLAAATVSTAGLTDAEELTLILVYIAVAGVLVWAPVATYVVAGRRASAWLAAGEMRLMQHRRPLTVGALLAFGAILVADGLLQL